MGDQDRERARPSLEPPRLFGGRKKDKTTAATPAVEVDAEPEHGAMTIFEVDDDEFEEMIPEDAADPDLDGPIAVATRSTAERTPANQTRTRAAPRTTAASRPKPARTPKPPRQGHALLISGRLAAVLTGLVVGLLMIGLVFLGFQACEQARGTSSCGTGPGMLLLLAMLVIAVVVGGVLLHLCRVPDPGSTSFLAVGMIGVISLLFLIDVLDTWPMLIVIPATSALCYLGSWWVTTTFVEPAKD